MQQVPITYSRVLVPVEEPAASLSKGRLTKFTDRVAEYLMIKNELQLNVRRHKWNAPVIQPTWRPWIAIDVMGA